MDEEYLADGSDEEDQLSRAELEECGFLDEDDE